MEIIDIYLLIIFPFLIVSKNGSKIVTFFFFFGEVEERYNPNKKSNLILSGSLKSYM